MTQNKKDVKKLTVSIPDETEKKLRFRTQSEYRGIKGGLSIVVTKALEEYEANHPIKTHP